jgi:hypothetical protein
MSWALVPRPHGSEPRGGVIVFHPIRTTLLCVAAAAACAHLAARPALAQDPARYLAVWTGDSDRVDSDFLAVIDITRGSPNYATVVASVPVGARATNPHHTEYAYTPGRSLFASGWGGNRIFRFDLSQPRAPRDMGEVALPPQFAYSHSFARLPDGDVVATMQASDTSDDGPGGLVRFHDDGIVVATGSAAVPSMDPARLRPYSLAVLPDQNRVVTASATMGLPDWNPHSGALDTAMMAGAVPANVQLWDLSRLRLLATVRLDTPQAEGPRVPACFAHAATCPPGLMPMEPRVLSDGRTVLVATELCGLYRVHGLDAASFGADLVYRFEGVGCSVPLVIGRYWLQAIISTDRVVVLDVADPTHPREVSRLQLGSDQTAHWISADADGRRIAIGHVSDADQRLWLADFDPATGAITMDTTFHDPGSATPGVSFCRESWPHGRTGSAIPHGAVFVP